MKKIFVIAAILSCLYACKKGVDATNTVDCGTTTKSFAADVKPIMQASCAFDSDCHGSGSNSGPGSLLNYSEIFNARSSIRSAVLSGNMPKGASLTASEKSAIICWIDNGAANN
jgi:hypothetical protein